MNEIIQKVKQILITPHKFFANLKEEELSKPFIHLVILSLIRLILLIVVAIPLGAALAVANDVFAYLGRPGLLGIPVLIVNFILVILISFVFVAILHLWIKIFRGKGNYIRTYQLFAYSYTPFLLLGWFPILRTIGTIWTLIILIVGTKELHKIKNITAILMYVVPAILFFVLEIIFLLQK